jgi:hypothetical protein
MKNSLALVSSLISFLVLGGSLGLAQERQTVEVLLSLPTKGQALEGAPGYLTYFVQEGSKESGSVAYLSLIGSQGGEGEVFHPQFFSEVREQWTPRAEGGFRVHLTLNRISLAGDLLTVKTEILEFNRNKELIGEVLVRPMGPPTAQELDLWQKSALAWAEVIGRLP